MTDESSTMLSRDVTYGYLILLPTRQCQLWSCLSSLDAVSRRSIPPRGVGEGPATTTDFETAIQLEACAASELSRESYRTYKENVRYLL